MIASLLFASALLLAMPPSGLSQSKDADEFARKARQAGQAHLALKAWTAYTTAQRLWQQDLADFLSRRRPDLKPTVQVSRDLQLAIIDRKTLEFIYLLKTYPERIVTNKGISQFSNFDWTDQDAEALRRANPVYAVAEKRVKDLRQRNDADPAWPVSRAAYRSLAQDPEHQRLYAQFQQRLKDAEKLLAGG